MQTEGGTNERTTVCIGRQSVPGKHHYRSFDMHFNGSALVSPRPKLITIYRRCYSIVSSPCWPPGCSGDDVWCRGDVMV